MSPLDKAQHLITRFEQNHTIDTGVRWVAQTPLVGLFGDVGARWDWPVFGSTLYLAKGLEGRELEEVVYHEMGHSIFAEYDLTPFMGAFTRREVGTSIADYLNYAKDGARFASQGRVDGFVSGYARTTREEDFCETLACYLVNGERTRGRFEYAFDEFTTRGDARVARKLDAIAEILEACERAEIEWEG